MVCETTALAARPWGSPVFKNHASHGGVAALLHLKFKSSSERASESGHKPVQEFCLAPNCSALSLRQQTGGLKRFYWWDTCGATCNVSISSKKHEWVHMHFMANLKLRGTR